MKNYKAEDKYCGLTKEEYEEYLRMVELEYT